MKHKLFSLLLAVVVSVGTMNAEIKNGTCGTNLTWSLNTEDSTLTISGTGAMSNYNISNNPAPWRQDSAYIKHLILEDGVTSIGSYAFYDCINLISVTIPNSVESIGNYAFQFCSNLPFVTIPQNVTSIGKQAFRGCSGLKWFACKAVTPPTLGSDVFYGVHRKTPMFVPSASIDNYKNAAWWSEFVNYISSWGDCGDNLMWYLNTIDGTLTIQGTGSMTDYTSSSSTPWYNYRSSIQSISLPDGMTIIGKYAFSGCTGLTSITIPNNVTNIGSSTFSNCSNLTLVTVLAEEPPASTSSTFSNVAADCSIIVPCGTIDAYQSAWSSYSSMIKNAPSAYHVTLLADAEKGYINAADLTECNEAAYTMTAVAYNGYSFIRWSDGNTENPRVAAITSDMTFTAEFGPATSGTCGTNLTWAVSIADSTLTIQGTGAMTNYNLSNNPAPWLTYSSCIKQVVIAEGVTSIGNSAFVNCKNYKSIEIPTSITKIGGSAFYGCGNLEAVYISNVANWCSIEFGASAANPLIYSKKMYINGDSVQNLVIPNTVTEIKDYAFKGCSTIKTVELPSSLTNIGTQAFYDCTGLTGIVCHASAVPTLGTNTWGNVDKTIPLYVPNGSVSSYANASGWNDFTTIASVVGGTCGENLQWSYNSLTKVLTISGSGDMSDYGESYNTAPWNNCSITSITINEGVTGIGSCAFWRRGIKSITIPNSVTKIGEKAFYQCWFMETLTIGEGVNSIGQYAFSQCDKLTSVTLNSDALVNKTHYASKNIKSIFGVQVNEYIIGGNVTAIGQYAFYGCKNLSSLTIGDGVVNIGDRAFKNCTGLTSINVGGGNTKFDSRDSCNAIIETASNTLLLGCRNTIMPNDIITIEDEAFYACSDLSSISIPHSITNIGDSAFWNCNSLTSISINSNYIMGRTYSSSSNLRTIFGSQVTEYIIGDSITSIGDYAFFNCSRVTSVKTNSVTYIRTITIPNSVTSIGQYAFNGCSSLIKSVTIPNSVTSIGNLAFSSRASVTLNSNAIVSKNYTSSSSLKDIFGTQVTEYIIGDSVTGIGNYAFYGCTGLISVIIPNSVTSIGNYAFQNCTSLISVTIGDGVTSIGYYAFNGCSRLTSITIPNSVTSIGQYAFDGCSNLTSVTIGDGVTSIGGYAFNGCSNLTSVTIPNSVTSIGNLAFSGCGSLTSVTLNSKAIVSKNYTSSSALKDIFGTQVTEYIIGDSVTGIGNYAFYGCTGLTSVIIPNSVTSIGRSAFSGCSGLKSVIIPNSITSIGNSAFSGCAGLTSITIPNSVTSIGQYAFDGCSNLTSVTIGDGVTSIGGYAFNGCSNLTSVTIGNSVTSIGSSAFAYCTGLTSVTLNSNAIVGKNYTSSVAIKDIFGTQVKEYIIGDGITSIREGAFSGCTGLTSITIPNSVTSIGNYAFYGCGSLTAVHISDVAAWCAISFGYSIYDIYSNPLKYARKLYLNGKLITNLVIPSSVTSIGDYAFFYCTSLTSVIIPNSVTSIGRSAFSGCSGLTSVTIGDGVTSIGGYAFNGCSNLTSVTIGDGVTSIGDNAFSGCGSLTAVHISDVAAWCAISFGIDNSNPLCCAQKLYLNGKLITNLVIPSSVTSIGDYAFFYCTSLTSVIIPNSVTSIGRSAFSGCSGLTSVTIEAEIPPTLDSLAFSGTNYFPIYVPCGTLDAYKTAWSNYASRIQYGPLEYHITGNVNIEGSGNVGQLPQNKCEDVILISAAPNYGYHFAQWSDGNIDNPRTIILASDTSFTAEFAKNTYTISTTSANHEWGTTAGGKSALYLDEVEISATANYGYHFVKWNDNNTSNPRTVSVTEDKTYTATFAKDVYSITKNAEQGSISGNSSAEYLDFVTLTVTPDYGYHFTQWSDGNTDNPRTIVLTQDTTFTAEFGIAKSGRCGDNYVLQWVYNSTTKTLTISGIGALSSYYTYGLEAPSEVENLIIEEGVTAIGDSAFSGYTTLKYVSIASSVKTIYDQAFYNCTGLENIYSYREQPSNAYSNSFDGVNKFECTLHVLSASIDMYKAATGWHDFYYIQTIDAKKETEQITSVVVTPAENAAKIAWPINNGAATYTIDISKDGTLVCTLTFNANGQLTGIAFAAPSIRHDAAQETITGYSFTITSLTPGTTYNYSLVAKNAGGTAIDTKNGTFTTLAPTGIEDVLANPSAAKDGKVLHDGKIYILRDGKVYDLIGRKL